MWLMNKLGPVLSQALARVLLITCAGVAALCVLDGRYLAGAGFAVAAAVTLLVVNVVWKWWPRAVYLIKQQVVTEVLSTRMEYVPDGVEGVRAWIRTVAGNAGMHAQFTPGPDGTPDQLLVLTDANGGVIGVRR